MHIDELVVEITRRCNVACRHCMRGEPQKKNISDLTIDHMLDGIDSIGMITFTGGEPTLAVERIKYITKQIMQRGIALDGFYLVTNGKVASKELVRALIDLYMYIDPFDRDNRCSLILSKDQFHKEVIKDTRKADSLYSVLTFYHPEDRLNRIEMPINEGRAFEGLGLREVFIEPVCVGLDDDGNIERIESTVYVNALGDVIPSCDMSWESQEANKIGTVYARSIAEIYKIQWESLKKEAA